MPADSLRRAVGRLVGLAPPGGRAVVPLAAPRCGLLLGSPLPGRQLLEAALLQPLLLRTRRLLVRRLEDVVGAPGGHGRRRRRGARVEGGEAEDVEGLGGAGRRLARWSFAAALARHGEVPGERRFGENVKLGGCSLLLADLSERRFGEDVLRVLGEGAEPEHIHGLLSRGSSSGSAGRLQGADEGHGRVSFTAPPGGSRSRFSRFLGAGQLFAVLIMEQILYLIINLKNVLLAYM